MELKDKFEERFAKVKEGIPDLTENELVLLKTALSTFYTYGIEDACEELKKKAVDEQKTLDKINSGEYNREKEGKE